MADGTKTSPAFRHTHVGAHVTRLCSSRREAKNGMHTLEAALPQPIKASESVTIALFTSPERVRALEGRRPNRARLSRSRIHLAAVALLSIAGRQKMRRATATD